jgi:hypothetical protein
MVAGKMGKFRTRARFKDASLRLCVNRIRPGEKAEGRVGGVGGGEDEEGEGGGGDGR